MGRHLASLIGGSRTSGEIFAKSVHNDKYSHWDESIYFGDLENALGAESVVFITGSQTCSASEIVINGLRPFLDVATVGRKTCGKPVGMYGYDFCDIHIAPIEMKIVNALDEGDYFGGIVPDCDAEDDLARDFGDIREDSLKTALHHLLNRSCPDSSDTRKKVRDKPLREIEFEGSGKRNGAF